MADTDDKTEEPTGKRLSDARAKGQVVVSQEIKHFFVLLGGTMVVSNLLPGIFLDIIGYLKRFLALSYQVAPDEASLGDFVGNTMSHMIFLLIVPFILMAVMGVAGGMIQTGPLWAPGSLTIKWEKLNPMTGLKRLFSLNSVLELIKSFFKLLIVGTVAYTVIRPMVNQADQYLQMPVQELLKLTSNMIVRLMGSVVATVALIGGLDYIHKRYEFYKNMRMSKEEVKDEYKQAEGDPKIKGRIKQLRMQKARQRMMANVPNADVVITNPTHYAIALEYKPEKMDAPVIVAMGMDLIAQKIKEIAQENKITFVSNPPLARALYENGDIDQPIPVEQYHAVAEVISYIFSLRQRRGGRR